MKDTRVSITTSDLVTVQNDIGLERIKVESTYGKCALKTGVCVRLEWPSGIQLHTDEFDLKPFVILFENGMDTPHGICVEIMLTDLVDNNDIGKVALAMVSSLKIYADFAEEKFTFEVISPRGATYGAQSISIHDTQLETYFDLKEDEDMMIGSDNE